MPQERATVHHNASLPVSLDFQAQVACSATRRTQHFSSSCRGSTLQDPGHDQTLVTVLLYLQNPSFLLPAHHNWGRLDWSKGLSPVSSGHTLFQPCLPTPFSSPRRPGTPRHWRKLPQGLVLSQQSSLCFHDGARAFHSHLVLLRSSCSAICSTCLQLTVHHGISGTNGTSPMVRNCFLLRPRGFGSQRSATLLRRRCSCGSARTTYHYSRLS